jgi:hypothetical protein
MPGHALDIAQQYALAYPPVRGIAKPLEDAPDKRVTLFFWNPKYHPHVPSKNALICTKACSFTSSMLISMPRIMTGPANQFQTHVMLEIRQSFRLISYWQGLSFERSAPIAAIFMADAPLIVSGFYCHTTLAL